MEKEEVREQDSDKCCAVPGPDTGTSPKMPMVLSASSCDRGCLSLLPIFLVEIRCNDLPTHSVSPHAFAVIPTLAAALGEEGILLPPQ